MADLNDENLNESSREELLRQLEKLNGPDELPEEQGSSQDPESGAENEPTEENEEPKDADNAEETDTAKEASAEKKKRPRGYLRVLRNVCISLTVTAAVAVLVVYFFFPVMRIYGSSMSSTLVDGDIVIAKKTTKLEQGDICAFSYGGRILCKRVIGLGGDVIVIDDQGTVFVNGTELDEPYLKGKTLGEDCDIEFPYTVPENSYFVLGDNRRASIDSRSSVVGCVSEEQVVGKLLFCIMPLPSIGAIK